MESIKETRQDVLNFLSKHGSGYGNGYGNGNGYGYGFGNGDGDGYSNGSGNGFGDGYGFGNGNGYGNGNGSGSGYGNGDGYSNGSGSGFGDGYGDGYGDIMKIGNNIVHSIDETQTIIYSVHQNYAKGAILKKDLTLKPCYIAKVEGHFAHGETLREALQDATAKATKALPVEERIERFISTYPNPDVKHIGREFFDWHNILTGSCTMGRENFCKEHSIDLDADYTPMEFLNLCKDAYGSEVIRQVIEEYKQKQTVSHES